MKVAFLGGLHGHIYHALTVLATWQAVNRQRLDLIIQVGDLGAYPDPGRLPHNGRRGGGKEAVAHDFRRYLYADDETARRLRELRHKLLPSIYFVRGEHDDAAWLRRLAKGQGSTVGVDQYEILTYVVDGTVMDLGGLTIAFLGGVELYGDEVDERQLQLIIDELTYRRLMGKLPKTIDVLVTHDLPFGVGVGRHGLIQGSLKVLDLIETLQPRYHVAGHADHLTGWRQYGRTRSVGLNRVITADPCRCGYVQQGSLAVLDTDTDTFTIVTDDWLCHFDQELNFSACVDRLVQHAPMLR